MSWGLCGRVKRLLKCLQLVCREGGDRRFGAIYACYIALVFGERCVILGGTETLRDCV